jgi:hypothetical protein
MLIDEPDNVVSNLPEPDCPPVLSLQDRRM